jgi:CubicO group peptidase (beta-lactamase class C family)
MFQGDIHPDFWPVARTLSKQIPKNGQGGAAVCVYHRGEPVVDIWAGTKDKQGSPWERDTVSLSYSTTKGVASTALHIVADRGLVDYDAPVATYWPEFAQSGKHAITVRQILCHEAGLYDIRHLIDDAARMVDWEYMTEILAGAEPAHAPGEAHGYHGLTYGWLVGEIVRRVTGKPLGEFVAAEIAAPLGLDGLFIGLPADQMHRRAMLITPMEPGPKASARMRRSLALGRGVNRALRAARIPIDLSAGAAALLPHGMDKFDFNAEHVVAASIPAANGMFTARSLARMYAALGRGGELDGVRLISQETMARVMEVQNRKAGRVIPIPMQWRLGYHRAMVMSGKVPRAFGHAGFGGSGAWTCPDRDLSVAMVLNSGIGTPFGDARIVQIGTAALRAAERRAG